MVVYHFLNPADSREPIFDDDLFLLRIIGAADSLTKDGADDTDENGVSLPIREIRAIRGRISGWLSRCRFPLFCAGTNPLPGVDPAVSEAVGTFLMELPLLDRLCPTPRETVPIRFVVKVHAAWAAGCAHSPELRLS